MSRTNRLLLDAAILVGYLAANNPRATGVAAHEWLSVGLALVVAVHLALNWEWIGHATRKLFGRLRAASKLNFVVDVVLFVAFVVVMLSGLLISKTVMGTLGIQLATGGGVWKLAHAQAAQVALWALAVHFALHWRWMLDTAKRLVASRRTVGVATEGGEL